MLGMKKTLLAGALLTGTLTVGSAGALAAECHDSYSSEPTSISGQVVTEIVSILEFLGNSVPAQICADMHIDFDLDVSPAAQTRLIFGLNKIIHKEGGEAYINPNRSLDTVGSMIKLVRQRSEMN